MINIDMRFMKIKAFFSFLCLFGLFLPAHILLVNLPKHASAGEKQKESEVNRGRFARGAVGESEKKGGHMEDTGKLTEEEGRHLLKVARQTIEKELFARKDQNLPESDISSKFSEQRGTFVTLTIRGGLRGCIGHIIPRETLIEGIRINAINAAFRDPRFRPLTKEEWDMVSIEISILTDPKPLSYSDADDLLKKLRPGIDGLIIKKAYHQATFLPQVWEQLREKEAFLSHLCQKAGLEGDAWKSGDLEVLTYQVQAFEE